MPNGEEKLDFPVCHFELPPRICADLAGSVTAAFYEIGGDAPTNVIGSGQDSEVRVEIEFGGPSAHLFCLTWCVCVAFESCGKGIEDDICIKDIPWDPCNGEKTVVTVPIPKGTLPAKDCGAVYGLCVTVTAKDQCGHPAPIAAMCRGAWVMVYDVHSEF